MTVHAPIVRDPRLSATASSAGAGRRAAPPAQPPALSTMLRGPRRVGLGVVLAFIGFFAVWGSLAQLSGGAAAPARISPDGGVKIVQHLEGGILRELHVREGDVVAAGAPLATLENVRAQAEVRTLLDRRWSRLAERARLEAERLGLPAPIFPPELDPRRAAAQEAMRSELRLFEARREMIATRRRVLEQRVRQLEEQIAGHGVQVESASRQLALIEEELSDKSGLLAKGLASKGEVLRLRRAAAEIDGLRGEHLASVALARQRIGETELELVSLDAERAEEVAARAGQLRQELAEIEESLAAERDVLSRSVVASPADGVVTNLRIKTRGGVIGPGEPILDVVPTNDRLLIDARVSPADVDLVEVGLEARIHLTAYAGRAAPTIVGTVTHVSADAVEGADGEPPYFLARIEAPAAALAAAGEDVRLIPGMTAEALIVTERRSLVDYLVQPIADVLRRALREA